MTDEPTQEAQEPAPEPGEHMSTLEQIERLARLQFKTSEVALVLGIEDTWPEASPEWRAYCKGRLTGEAENREAVRRGALQGSQPAQKQFGELCERSTRQCPDPAPKPAPQPDPPRRRR